MAIALEEGSFDALLFDCDGTLVDTAAAHFRSLQRAFERHGLAFEAPFYNERTGLSPDGLLSAYEEAYGALPISRKELLGVYAADYQENMDAMEEIAVVAAVARAWQGRVPMGVVSNGQRWNVVGSLRSTGLLDLFDTVVTVEDVVHGKPAPDLYLEGARRLAVPAGRCMVFEDTDEGIASGRAAGMPVVDVRAHLRAAAV